MKSCLLCVNWVFHSISQLSGKDSHPPYAPRLLPQAPSKQLKTSPDTSQLFFFLIYIIMPRNLDSLGFVLHFKTIYSNTGPGIVSSGCILSFTTDLIHKDFVYHRFCFKETQQKTQLACQHYNGLAVQFLGIVNRR